MFWYDDEDAHNPLQLRMINNKYTLQDRLCVCVTIYCIPNVHCTPNETHSQLKWKLFTFFFMVNNRQNEHTIFVYTLDVIALDVFDTIQP